MAAVLHDVHLAKTEGSGSRVMRELMVQHELLPPTFESSRRRDQFVATLLFHHFLGEGDLRWLRTLTGERLSDEEARALVFVREMGAIDNAAYRSINRVETLARSAPPSSSGHRPARDEGGTYYVAKRKGAEGKDLHQPSAEVHQFPADLHQVHPEVHQLPEELQASLDALGQRPRQDTLRSLIRALCAWKPFSARSLGQMCSSPTAGGAPPR